MTDLYSHFHITKALLGVLKVLTVPFATLSDAHSSPLQGLLVSINFSSGSRFCPSHRDAPFSLTTHPQSASPLICLFAPPDPPLHIGDLPLHFSIASIPRRSSSSNITMMHVRIRWIICFPFFPRSKASVYIDFFWIFYCFEWQMRPPIQKKS
jgi:hypothetical protein